MNTDTSIATIESMNAVELFQGDSMKALLDAITKETKSEIVDPSSEKGRGRIKSLAYKVARSKTAIDTLGKNLVSEWKEKSEEVDATRKTARDYLDELKLEVRQPVTDWEESEQARVDKIKQRIDSLKSLGSPCDEYGSLYSLAHLNTALETLHGMTIDESYAELKSIAQKAGDDARASLEENIALSVKAEAEAQELERLRKAEEDRKVAEAKRLTEEREALIAKEAAEKAQREAEEKANAERLEAERKAAEDLAEAKRAAAEQKAESERKEQALRDEKEKAQREVSEAKKAAAKAITDAENKRIWAEKLKQEALAKREADTEHRRKINNQTVAALKQMTDIGDATAKQVVEAVAKNQIPSVRITY